MLNNGLWESIAFLVSGLTRLERIVCYFLHKMVLFVYKMVKLIGERVVYTKPPNLNRFGGLCVDL